MKNVVLSLACLGIMALSGCGSGSTKYTITGQLTKGGQPLIVGETTQIMLSFAPQIEGVSKSTYPASAKREDGTYVIKLDPGKYKVNLIIADHGKSPPAVKSYLGVNNAVYDVTENRVIDIDIP
jgi:hypothetical protein